MVSLGEFVRACFDAAKSKIENRYRRRSTLLRINYVELSIIESPNYPVCSGQDVAGNNKNLDFRLFRSSNHSIRPRQHIRRNGQRDLPGGFEIDHQLEFRRLLDGQLRRFGAL